MNVAFRWILRCLLRLVLIPVCAVAAQGPPAETFALDPTHSKAGFEVKVLWLIGLHGRFGAVHGSVLVDRFHATATVDARINANDLRMHSSNYAKWARSAEFFDAQHYPQIHFVSDSFPLIRMRNGGEVTGTLTIRGIVKRVRFMLQPSTCTHPLNAGCAVHAEGHIRRSDFGMHSRRGTLADKVGLQLSILVKPTSESMP
ncbi:MAG: YceI family protein [Rudaea sp.]